MNVAVSATFEATSSNFASGLTGSMRVRILDNAGGTTTAATTSGIAEFPSGSGVYYVSLTAPSTPGQYSIVWDTGTLSPYTTAVEDLTVTVSAFSETASPIAGPSQPLVVWAQGFASGLTGTLGVRILNNAGGTTTARVTTGIAEAPSGSGCYLALITAPAALGQYGIVWDDGTNYAVENLTVGAVTNAVVIAAVNTGSLTASPASAGTLTPAAGSAGSLTLTPVTPGSLTLS